MSLYKRLHDVQAAPATGNKRRDPVLDELRQKIHHHLIDELGPILYDKRLSEDDLRRRVNDQLHAALAQERAPLSAADKAQLIQDVSDDILGYGPIDRLLNDEEVTEVMCNGPDSVYVERNGQLEKTDATFVDETHLRRIIDKIVSEVGRRIDESNAPLRRPPPGRLPRQRGDPPAGHRRPVPHHPEVLQGEAAGRRPHPVRHAQRPLGPLPAGLRRRSPQHHRLRRYRHRQDHDAQRAVVVHPRPTSASSRSRTPRSSRCTRTTSCRMEARPPNIEGRGEVTIRDLVKNCLRMRPDRIVVGECRSGEALDMLQAMNTGHDGSLTTVHANSPRDTLARLETLVLMAGLRPADPGHP